MYPLLEINVSDLELGRSQHVLVDVREPHELIGPEGQIEGVVVATLGEEFVRFLISADPEQSYIFICRSGHRSAHACAIAHTYGFFRVYNLIGGMLAWNQFIKT